MNPYHQVLIDGNQELIDRMSRHPLLAGFRRRDLPEEQERYFAEQGYFFIRDYEEFLGILCAAAPESSRPCMTRLLLDLHQIAERFQEYTAEKLVLSQKLRMNRQTRSLASLLHRMVHYHSFEEALSAWFAFYMALSQTMESMPEAAPPPDAPIGRLPGSFLDEGFPSRFESLLRCVDTAATNATRAGREKMAKAFQIAIYYVLRSIDAIVDGPDGADAASISPPDGARE